MNEHFVQSELEYRRQQRLASAAQFRRARSAQRAGGLRSRFTAAVEHLGRGRRHGATGTGTAGATHAA